MSNIKSAINDITASIPPHVQLIAVSKTKPASAILEAYNSGQRHFGENKAQEILSKAPALPEDIRWHFIGHLQSKKVKQIIPYTHLIHSVDSEKLLREIHKRADQIEKVQNVLLQIHIASETHKFGLSIEECETLIPVAQNEMPGVNICGLMGMATFTTDKNTIASEFKALHSLFTSLKAKFFSSHPDFKEISMGMSGDYPLAIENGSTMVRIGSSIFGSRTYS